MDIRPEILALVGRRQSVALTSVADRLAQYPKAEVHAAIRKLLLDGQLIVTSDWNLKAPTKGHERDQQTVPPA